MNIAQISIISRKIPKAVLRGVRSDVPLEESVQAPKWYSRKRNRSMTMPVKRTSCWAPSPSVQTASAAGLTAAILRTTFGRKTPTH